MQVIIESRSSAPSLRGLALRRVRQALRQLSWLAPRARVHMSEIPDVRDGIDKRCQIELSADGAAPVVVASITRDWHSALQSALSRAIRALLRKLPSPNRAPSLRAIGQTR